MVCPATHICLVVESHAILEELTANFSWYYQLYGFWQTIPSHNRYPATSYPGQDMGTLATILVGHQSAVPEDAVYPLHLSMPPIGTPRSSAGTFYPLDPSAPLISTDNVINLNDNLPLNLSNLLDHTDMGLDPSSFQNIYLMGSVTSSGIGTSLS
jgi:hypothetical protein